MENKETFNEGDVRKFYTLLAHDNETEIRLIDPHEKEHPKSIFVNNVDEFLDQCSQHNGRYNVYAGINERKHFGTMKADVLGVKTVVVDIDPTRPDMKQPSTKEELGHALESGKQIQDFLLTSFKIISFSAMSGNGVQIYIPIRRIDLSDEKDNREPIENFIKAFHRWLAQKFNSDHIKIDNIGDLPRIIKVIGTISIKGKDTEERPHRRSYWIDSFETRFENDDNKTVFNTAYNALEGNSKKETVKQTIFSLKKHPKYSIIFLYDYNKMKRIKSEDRSLIKMLEAKDDSGYESTSEKEFAMVIRFHRFGLSLKEVDEIMTAFGSDKWIHSPQQYKDMTYAKTKEIVENELSVDDLMPYISMKFKCIKIYPSHEESLTEIYLDDDDKIILDSKSITIPTKFRSQYYMLRSILLPTVSEFWWHRVLTFWTKMYGIKIEPDKMIVKGLDEYTIIRDSIISELQTFDLTDKIDESIMYGKMYVKDNLDKSVYVFSGHMSSILKKNHLNITLAKLSHTIKNDLANKTTNIWIDNERQERFWVLKREVFNGKMIPKDTSSDEKVAEDLSGGFENVPVEGVDV